MQEIQNSLEEEIPIEKGDNQQEIIHQKSQEIIHQKSQEIIHQKSQEIIHQKSQEIIHQKSQPAPNNESKNDIISRIKALTEQAKIIAQASSSSGTGPGAAGAGGESSWWFEGVPVNSVSIVPTQNDEMIFKNLIEISRDSMNGGGSNVNRYFQEEETVVCKFCRKSGHMLRNCTEKEKRCTRCRKDHDPLKCPLAIVCFWCYRLGHSKNDCRSLASSRYCVFCDTSTHSTQECQKLWRDYIFERNCSVKLNHPQTRRPTPYTNKNKPVGGGGGGQNNSPRPPDTSFNVSCYNCGSTDHFGDFCKDFHSSRYSQVTAFDVTSNETRDLRKQIQSYFSKHSNNKNSKKEFTFSKAIPSGSKFLDTLNRGRPQSNQKASNHNNNASNSNKGGGGGGGVSKKKNKKRKVPAGSSSSRPTSTSRPPSRPPNKKNSSHFKGKRNN